MLVLSRRVGERLIIGDGIAVQVLDVQGGRVRLGIEAPPEVAVWREELAVPAPEAAGQRLIRKPR